MEYLDKKANQIFSKFRVITPWLLRLGLGISFFFHGYGKFPLPPQKLIDYFGFSEALASFVVADNGSIAATLVFSLYELWFTNNPFYAAMVTLSVIKV